MSMRKFYHFLDIQKPKSFPELLKAFSMVKIYLYDAKKITIRTVTTGKDVSGARNFKYRYVEPLQFWNSSLEIEHIKLSKGNPEVIVETNDGTTHSIEAKSKNSADILNEVLEFSKGKKINVNVPV